MLTDTLYLPFITAMNEIGRYGATKYKQNAFNDRMEQGEGRDSRDRMGRLESTVICAHIFAHNAAYMRGELHDHFGTRKHQLAAVAFNAMMEFYFHVQEQKGK